MKPSGPLGVLMLDTRFPRPVGDIGCAESFPFPVLYRTIPKASANEAVRGDAEAFFDAFLLGAEALVADGARAISTSCGFLCVFQQRLAAALPVPVVSSSLLSYGAVQRSLPEGKRVGILTIDAAALSGAHLSAAGVSAEAKIVGLPRDSSLSQMIFSDAEHLDFDLATSEMVDLARQLAAAESALGAVLLECTNMGPYADAIRAELGLPVIGIVDILKEMMAE